MKHAIPLCFLCLGWLVQAQPSDDSSNLKDTRKRFPEADSQAGGATKASGLEDGRGDGIRSSYIYKTVGNYKLEAHVDMPKGHKPGAKIPAMVLFHGGGFRTGSVDQFKRQAEHLAARGMVAFRVRYRLIKDPSVEIKDCVEDAKSAMRWVRGNAGKLGVDPDRIAAGGGSAGGYLAAATLLIDFYNATTDAPGVSAKPDAMVLFNPAFGGRNKDGVPDRRDPEGKGTLANYVKAKQPPMISFFGTEDPLLPGARQFVEVYQKAGNRCELLTYEGQTHSFFNKGKYLDLTLAEADKFLVGLGWLSKP